MALASPQDLGTNRTADRWTAAVTPEGFGREQLDTCSFRDRFVSVQEEIKATRDFLESAAIIAIAIVS